MSKLKSRTFLDTDRAFWKAAIRESKGRIAALNRTISIARRAIRDKVSAPEIAKSLLAQEQQQH